MKKLISTFTTLALCATMSVSTFAATPITSVNGTDSAEVKGTYQAGTAAATVYSVDIAWGSMEFTYTEGTTGTWSPTNHSYSGSTPAAWSCTDGANKITVTNHSNKAVDATLSYGKVSGYDAINGTFTDLNNTQISKLVLATADGTAVSNAPKEEALLKLSGVLTAGVNNTKIGTVTVSITEPLGIDGGEASLD